MSLFNSFLLLSGLLLLLVLVMVSQVDQSAILKDGGRFLVLDKVGVLLHSLVCLNVTSLSPQKAVFLGISRSRLPARTLDPLSQIDVGWMYHAVKRMIINRQRLILPSPPY